MAGRNANGNAATGKGNEATGKGSETAGKGGEAPITIKKYANRRLYNTATSSYVTLDHLSQMVKDGVDFVVYDAKSGDDITRSVLTQIIVEEEAKGGQNLLPVPFLRQLITFYGDSLGGLVPQYLEHTMQTFARNQEEMREYMQNALEGMFPFGGQLEEMGKQNMAILESAMRMFNPFDGAAQNQPNRPGGEGQAGGPGQGGSGIEDLQKQVEALQKQLDRMNKDDKGGEGGQG